MEIIKKDGTSEKYNFNKIKKAVTKSASRAMVKISEEEWATIKSMVEKRIKDKDIIPISSIHNIVEDVLENFNADVAKSYKDYRNYKKDFVHMIDEVYQKSQSIRFLGDKENSNTDSTLVATKRCLIFNELNREFYKKFFMTRDELQACKDGYIYIHDQSARLDTMNCCICDVAAIMKDGFEMGNVWYNEPKTLDTAFDVLGDIIIATASQQYGGFTIPEVDKILSPYAKKSYDFYVNEYFSIINDKKKSEDYALKKVQRDFEQGFQGIEMKLNTVGSSRGDYPFVTMTFGLATDLFGKMASKTFLKVHMNGQGKKENKKPVLFPKLVFLYDKDLHSKGCINEDVFDAGIECSMKTMYPDWLSLTGEGYVAEMYKKYKKVVSPMGCVDGQEIITYKYNYILYVESFERMWKRISKDVADIGQNSKDDVNRIIDLREKNVFIYDTLKGFTKINYLIRNVQNNWNDVNVSNGRTIRVTTDHPFDITRNGENITVKAEDLKINDLILTNKSQYSENSIYIPIDLAWLNGVILCDGCYQNYKLNICLNAIGEDDIKENVIKIFKKYFSVCPKIVKQNRGNKGKYYDINILLNGDSTLRELTYMFTNLFEGVNKKYRHIPAEVFSYNYYAKLAFLAGMIDADGYINNSKKLKCSTVQIGSVNKELALQQMALAQALGMPAKIYKNHYTKQNKNKIRYRIEFIPSKDLLEFVRCKKKKDKAIKILENTQKSNNFEKIVFVSPVNITQYSYDVTTESSHFEVSGIYSHNCRAFLSPWYEKGGMYPIDENDTPVFVGRFNIGVVSLHLPMILAKSRQENKDFYEVLDYYLEMIRNLHKRTYEYIGEMKASTNPVMYCEGGAYGGHLSPSDKIKPLLKPMTASFGITALNELQQLYNGKSIVEDGKFAIEVMEYINKKIEEYKKEDGWLYAIYGSPAESLCGKQIEQFRKMYGIVENVSDRPYVSNSFHCHVSEDITPIQKQDLEKRFWDLFNGGKIQYVKYPLDYNKEAVVTLVNRAMKFGFYEGVNLSLAYCDDCGHQELEMDVCPKCGSRNLTKIDRMNGYLSYSRVHGDTRLNDAKMAEIKERKSM